MRYPHLLIVPALLAAACSSDDKKAADMYAQAEQCYNNGDYYTAKLWIDSIATTYPKAFDAIREGMVLQCRINREVYEKDLITTDSLYNMAQKELDELRPKFDLTRESEYQTERNYIYKKARPGEIVTQSGLRAQVTESGEFRLISIYNGKAGINHTAIRLENSDGSYCETATIAFDGAKNYRFSSGGKTTEMVTYNTSQCYSVAEQIVLAGNKKLTVRYMGGSNYAIPLDKSTRVAIAETYRLAQVLALTDSLTKRREYGIKQLEIADAQLMRLLTAEKATQE